jgi:hypothetical protein
MTEYTTDHYPTARRSRKTRTANWVGYITGKTLAAPSAPPSLPSDSDDGLSSDDSDAESSHSLPPRMILRYPDGRPDVTVSDSWSQEPLRTSPIFPHHHTSRPPPGSHGHHQSNPDLHSRVPSNVVPSPVIATHPETTHIRSFPTGPPLSIQQSPPDAYSPDPHSAPSALPLSRSRSNRPSKPPQESLQVYSPPPPPAPPSSQSHRALVLHTGEGFQPTQRPPPLPQPGPIIVPSPVVFTFPTSPPAPPQAAPPTGSSRTHSRTHPNSSNHPYSHPPAQPSSNPTLPPTLYHTGPTAQRPHRHSSRAGSSSHIGPHPHPHPPSQFAHVGSQQSSSHTGRGISPPRRHGHGVPSIVYPLSPFHGGDPHIGGSSSSLVTIGPPTNHEHPQLRPYPSSTALQSNGSVCNASFITSPSDYASPTEVRNDIAEVRLPEHDHSLQSYLASSKDMSRRLRQGFYKHYP